jgi:gluconokinase
VTNAVVIMGVSGCGKSTLGSALAAKLAWRFIEGDTLHPESNIAKMAAGLPLDDEDRRPFLERVACACAEEAQTGVVVSCSALKRRYRDLIRSRVPGVAFVLPLVDRERLLARLEKRHDHFMPASLLESQLAALELPGPDEPVIVVDGSAAPEEQLAQSFAALQAMDSNKCPLAAPD